MGNKTDKVAVLIAESVATMVEALGWKSFNDERMQNGLSAGYTDTMFSCIADDLRTKIETFKKEIEETNNQE